MLAIDHATGTHFIDKKFTLTPHAVKAVRDRLKIKEADVASFVGINLRKASFVGMVISDDGTERRMFAYQRIAFILAADEDVVVTVYQQHTASEVLRGPLEKAAAKVIAAAERKEKTACKAVSISIAELGVKRAEALLRKTKTTSRRVEMAADIRIAEIDEEIAKLERSIIDIKREKTSLIKGMVAYL